MHCGSLKMTRTRFKLCCPSRYFLFDVCISATIAGDMAGGNQPAVHRSDAGDKVKELRDRKGLDETRTEGGPGSR